MSYEVIRSPIHDDIWVVESIDEQGEGQVFIAQFIGPNAEARAREYAAWKLSNAE